MAGYYLAPSLKQLRSEIDKAHPKRDRRSDGWVGDTRHAASKSDHNPDYPDGGVVRALDIDKDGVNMTRLLAVVLKNSSTNYVIWNGHIYSRKFGFSRRVYTGTNKHTAHMHISIRHGKSYENSTKRWGYTAASASTVPTAPKPAPPRDYGNCQKLQTAVRVTADNHWGEGTEKACNAVRWAAQTKFPSGVKYTQGVIGVKQDGAWGGISRRALQVTIRNMQSALVSMAHTNLELTGVWDHPTEMAYQKVRNICKRF